MTAFQLTTNERNNIVARKFIQLRNFTGAAHSMADTSLGSLAAKVDQLVKLCDQLSRENKALREKESLWVRDRSRLIEKNELARSRVESMISRLKSLETEV